MSTKQEGSDMSSSGIGKSAEEVEAEQPSDDEVAAALGFDSLENEQEETGNEASNEMPSQEELWTLVQSQQEVIEGLQTQVGDLQRHLGMLEDRVDDVEDNDEKRKEMAAQANEAAEKAEEAKEIAKSASATVEQVRAEVEDDDDKGSQSLPGDVEPASNPLDFLANCRLHKVRRKFKENANKTNTYRAVAASRQWDEYATKRTNGRGIFWTRDDLEDALIEITGEKPHRQTITRVWENIIELAGDSVREKTRQVGPKQNPVDILEMDREDAEALLEDRYAHLDLLEETGATSITGGVTPVVTGGNGV